MKRPFTALIALLLCLVYLPTQAQNEQNAEIIWGEGSIVGNIGFGRAVAGQGLTSSKPEGAAYGPYAGYYPIGFPTQVRADSIVNSANNNRLVETSGGLTLYEWTEADGWSGIISDDVHMSRHQGAFLFLFDDEENDFDGGFELTMFGPATEIPPDTTNTLNASTSGSAWFLSYPWTSPYYDPQEMQANGAAYGSAMAETIQLWSPSEGQWKRMTVGIERTMISSFDDGFSNVECSGPCQYSFSRAHTPFFAEAHTTGSVTLNYPMSGVVGGDNFPLEENRSYRAGESAVELKLFAVQDDEQMLVDDKAALYFYSGATTSFDRYDASKLAPPLPAYAAIGLEGTKFGEPRMQSILSLPATTSPPISTDVRFEAQNVDGTFRLSAEATNVPPDWNMYVVDTKGTATTADNDTTLVGPSSSDSYDFRFSTRRNNTQGPPPMLVAQDAADAGETSRFELLILSE